MASVSVRMNDVLRRFTLVTLLFRRLLLVACRARDQFALSISVVYRPVADYSDSVGTVEVVAKVRRPERTPEGFAVPTERPFGTTFTFQLGCAEIVLIITNAR